MNRLGRPVGQGRAACVAAVAVWVGVSGIVPLVLLAVAALAGTALRVRATIAIVICVLAGTAGAAMAAWRDAAVLDSVVPTGRVVVGAVVVSPPASSDFGLAFTVEPRWIETADGRRRWHGPRLEVRAGDTVAGLDIGVGVIVRGRASDSGHQTRRGPVAGNIDADRIEVVGSEIDPMLRLGNGLRSRVSSAVDSVGGDGAALLSGFLIGDTSHLAENDVEALRRSGLSHFVAVSGGNVALLLAACWLVMGSLGVPARLRSAIGLVVIGVFVVATRWEPSVVRAAVMAGLVLVGRLAGLPVDAWSALGAAVAMLLIIAPGLSGDVGFQLSVLATAGLLVGAPLFATRRPRVIWTVLGATMSAQLAVLPLSLVVFGTVPLLAPLANLLAAPVVALSTSVGGLGAVFGVAAVTRTGAGLAEVVLWIARTASGWPQLGPSAACAVVVAGTVATRFRRWRAPVCALALLVALAAVMSRPGPPPVPTVTVIDVGQGDAVLLRSPGGETALVDGGAEPAILREALRSRGIRRLDLVVATHGDLDHVGGLVGIFDSADVAALWVPRLQQLDETLERIVFDAMARGAVVSQPIPGTRAALGRFTIEVLGPRRRYASQNDGSLVLLVGSGSQTMLLAGDVEAVAQRELPPLDLDVLLVPHHGSATSDLGWLAATVSGEAIISVGDNTYGHPAPEVVDLLSRLGVEVHVTRDEGDIDIPFP